MKIKITTGFDNDQKFTIDSEELHKAYYLFLNPEKRGIFSNGVALVGKDIRSIQPDYNAEMGWNASYKLTDFDFNEIKKLGLNTKFQEILQEGKRISQLLESKPELFSMPLSEVKLLFLE